MSEHGAATQCMLAQVLAASEAEIVASALKASHDMREAVALRPLLESEDYETGVVGRSEAMQTVLPSLFETMNIIHKQPVKSGGFGLWGLDQKGTFSSFEDQMCLFISEAKWEAWAKQHPFFELG